MLIWQDYALTSEAAASARPQSSCINLSGAVGQLWTCTERDLEQSRQPGMSALGTNRYKNEHSLQHMQLFHEFNLQSRFKIVEHPQGRAKTVLIFVCKSTRPVTCRGPARGRSDHITYCSMRLRQERVAVSIWD